MKSIEEAAKEYADGVGTNIQFEIEAAKQDFINGAESDAARHYWMKMFCDMFVEGHDIHYTPEFVESIYQDWIKSK
jgi:hypothetical protein